MGLLSDSSPAEWEELFSAISTSKSVNHTLAPAGLDQILQESKGTNRVIVVLMLHRGGDVGNEAHSLGHQRLHI